MTKCIIWTSFVQFSTENVEKTHFPWKRLILEQNVKPVHPLKSIFSVGFSFVIFTKNVILAATDLFWPKFMLQNAHPRTLSCHNFWTVWATDLINHQKFSIFYDLSLYPKTFFSKIPTLAATGQFWPLPLCPNTYFWP